MTPVPILFVHSGQAWIRGSEQCLLDLVTHVDRRRFTPVVLCDSPVLAEAAAAIGVPVQQVGGWPMAAQRWLPSRSEVATTRRIVDAHGIRLIHTNDTEPIKALLPEARRRGIPVLAHLHITIGEAERRWSFLHQVALAVGVSQAAVTGLREDGFPESRIAVVYNGVDPGRLEQGEATTLRQHLGIPGDHIVFAAVGSLITRKGMDVVLKAFDRVASRHARCHLLVCGDGPERAALAAQAAAMAGGDRVHLLGERRDIGAILRDAGDVFVSPSRQEAFPLTLLEAGYFGLPIIASAIAPHREFLGQDGGGGVLVPVDDSESLAHAMGSLAEDEPLRRAYGAEARRRVHSSYLVSHVVQRFEELYTGLLARPASDFGWVRGTTVPRSYRRWLTQRITGRPAPELVNHGARQTAADTVRPSHA